MAARDDLIEPLCTGLAEIPSAGWSANQALGYLQLAVGYDVTLDDVVDTLMDGIRAGVIEYTAGGYRLWARGVIDEIEGLSR